MKDSRDETVGYFKRGRRPREIVSWGSRDSYATEGVTACDSPLVKLAVHAPTCRLPIHNWIELLAGIVVDKTITKKSLEQREVDGRRFDNYSKVLSFRQPQFVTDLQRALINQYQDPL